MPSSSRLDIWATATGDFIVLLEWTGKLRYPELSLLTGGVIPFKESHKPGSSSGSATESGSFGKLLVTHFLWFFFLYCCCCEYPRAHLKYPGKGVHSSSTDRRVPWWSGSAQALAAIFCLWRMFATTPTQGQRWSPSNEVKVGETYLMVLCHCLSPGIFSQWIMTAQS